MATDKPTAGQCRDCRQGYTKEGFAAHPDHIELCPLHSAATELLAACVRVLRAIEWGVTEDRMTLKEQADTLRAVIDKTEPAKKEEEMKLASFCRTCRQAVWGQTIEGRKGFVDGSTMHIVGVATPKGAVALCGMRHDGVNPVAAIETVKLGGH